MPTVDVEIKASSVARAATLLYELNKLYVGKAKDVESRDSRRQRLRRSHLVGETTRGRTTLGAVKINVRAAWNLRCRL